MCFLHLKKVRECKMFAYTQIIGTFLTCFFINWLGKFSSFLYALVFDKENSISNFCTAAYLFKSQQELFVVTKKINNRSIVNSCTPEVLLRHLVCQTAVDRSLTPVLIYIHKQSGIVNPMYVCMYSYKCSRLCICALSSTW